MDTRHPQPNRANASIADRIRTTLPDPGDVAGDQPGDGLGRGEGHGRDDALATQADED